MIIVSGSRSHSRGPAVHDGKTEYSGDVFLAEALGVVDGHFANSRWKHRSSLIEDWTERLQNK